MSYIQPAEFASKMIDAGETKVFTPSKDRLIIAYMAGAILALAAAFAVTIAVNTGQFIVGALLFPVGFCTLYFLGFDLLTGVFTLCPLAVIAMWMPILIFFYLGFEHSIVTMFLFAIGILLAAEFTWGDYLMYNEIPTVIGNLVGGLTFVGAMIYSTHYKTSPSRKAAALKNNDSAGTPAVAAA